MPTYEYVCDACHHEFELFQPMSAPVKRKCPECGKPKLRRLIGIGAGVLFKGSGFYETDYRSDSYKKAAESETKSTGGDASTANESKADAKSDVAATPAKQDAPKKKPKTKKTGD